MILNQKFYNQFDRNHRSIIQALRETEARLFDSSDDIIQIFKTI